MNNQYQGHYKKDNIKTNIPPENQSYNFFSEIELANPNKGLYSGKVEINKYFPPNTPATGINHLKSFKKTPGANMHYVGTNRFGNNHSPMPGIFIFNPENGQNKYNIIGPL